MKNARRVSVILIIVSVIFMVACKSKSESVTTVPVEPTQEQLIQNGEYLVTIMGCQDCHSPKEMGPQGPVVIADLMLSGYPADRPIKKVDPEIIKSGWNLMNEDITSAAGMWGISFAANITSDPTGIGNWTEENFKRALKEGKYKGLAASRMLLPPMPWQNFVNLKDEDVKAMFAYLKSTKPVNNLVPQPVALADIK